MKIEIVHSANHHQLGGRQNETCTLRARVTAINKKANPLLLQGISTSYHTAPGRIRTGDLRITNALLYQLSHGSV